MIEIVECTEAEFDRLVAAEVVDVISRWQSENSEGMFRLGLTGGSSPLGVYGLIAENEKIDWKRVLCIVTDERFVGPDSEDSNLGMISDTLLAAVEIDYEQVVFWDTEKTANWERSAALMDQQIDDLVDEREPLFDLLLLGVGNDGHVASLFPGSEALRCEAWATVTTTEEFAVKQRLTLTMDALLSSERLFVLLRGDKKAPVLEMVESDGDLPVQQLLADIDEATVFFGA